MEPQQTATNEIAEIDAAVHGATHPPDVINAIDFRHQSLIDYMAMSGLVFDREASEYSTDKDGKIFASGAPLKKMTMQELADALNVDRATLYRWRDQIPDFWGKVAKRRTELSGQDRLTKIHQTWYLEAAKMKNWSITEAWLRNFDPGFKEPRTKVDVAVKHSWAAQLATKKNVIDGQIVNKENHGQQESLPAQNQIQSPTSQSPSQVS